MRVVQVSTEDIRGGAGRACHRLHLGLRSIGVDSTCLVRHKSSADEFVVVVDSPSGPERARELVVDRAIQTCYLEPRRRPASAYFSYTHTGLDLRAHETAAAADLVHLHWISFFQSPLDVRRLASSGRPVVWTLHDMRGITGGCHYSGGCVRYRESCSPCPQLESDPANLIGSDLQASARLLADANVTVVTPSRWLAARARESVALGRARIEVAPNAVDTRIFEPTRRSAGRQRLEVAEDEVVLLFGATSLEDPRKGGSDLAQALELALDDPRLAALVAAGRLRLVRFGEGAGRLDGVSAPVTDIPYSHDEATLAELYAAADVFILPSHEDNLPNTMLESLSCGTPVAAYAVGGIPEAIRDGETGWLAAPGDVRQLAYSLVKAITGHEIRAAFRARARGVAEAEYALEVQAGRMVALYSELLAEPHATASDAAVVSEYPDSARTARTRALVDALPEYARRIEVAYHDSEADRAARLAVLEQQGVEIGRLQAAQGHDDGRVAALQAHLDASEADRRARLEVIEQQGRELARIPALEAALAHSEADRAARLEVIERQGAELGRLGAELNRVGALEAELETLRAKAVEAQTDATALRVRIEVARDSRIYRVLRRLGLLNLDASERANPGGGS
jgi:glycosyltransferase involved in cell wall biosynthesis